jgi:AcrR family transcriptional regulator
MSHNPDSSLRERKKARARALIQDHALRLFAEQGYEATTVTQIAAAAEVSPSTLFRYFATKADIVRYDVLDPLLFAAYREQPPELRPIAALRAAADAMLRTLPRDILDQQIDRARLILSIPELRASSLGTGDDVERLLAEAEVDRTGRSPDPFALKVCVGALTGAITAALVSDPGGMPDGLVERLDRTLELLEQGLPL